MSSYLDDIENNNIINNTMLSHVDEEYGTFDKWRISLSSKHDIKKNKFSYNFVETSGIYGNNAIQLTTDGFVTSNTFFNNLINTNGCNNYSIEVISENNIII